MDGVSLFDVLKVIGQFGLSGVILVIWYYSTRAQERMHREHREDMLEVLHRYEHDMNEIRRMYESNVDLVKDYRSLAQDLKDVVTLNTQSMTRLAERLRVTKEVYE